MFADMIWISTCIHVRIRDVVVLITAGGPVGILPLGMKVWQSQLTTPQYIAIITVHIICKVSG